MARGSTNINIDAKGRIAIPTKHRDELMDACEGKLVVTVSPQDRCLSVYTLPEWEIVEKKIVALPTLKAGSRKLNRMLIGHAEDCVMDGNGRILLTAPLREFAMLNKKAVFVGQSNKFEIWDEARWLEHCEAMFALELDEDDLSAELEIISF